MTDQELRLVAEIIDRMHLNAAERQVEAVGRVRADSVTLSASYEQRIAALTKALQHEREANKRMSDEVIFQTNSHGKAMVERDGLLTQVQDLRAALAKEQELHAATALRMATDAAKMVERKHPVKVGDWVRRTGNFCHWGRSGEVAQVQCVRGSSYSVRRQCGEVTQWDIVFCEPCDPPAADHDTPEGKDVAESVIRDSRKTGPADEIKVGDVVEVFQATGDITATSDIGLRGTVLEIASEDKSVRLKNLTQNKEEWVDMCDVRKVTT